MAMAGEGNSEEPVYGFNGNMIYTQVNVGSIILRGCRGGEPAFAADPESNGEDEG